MTKVLAEGETRTGYHVRTQCVARLERVPESTEADGSDAREEARKNG